MSSLLETLTQSLGSNALGQMGQQIGANPATTGAAVSAALPVLIGALARSASHPQGAADLHGALADHDGSILDNVQGYLTGPNAGADGAGILGHLLGGQRGAVEDAVGQSAGLNAGSTAKLMELLAPIVMGSVGRAVSTQGLDASGLAGLLGQEHQTNSQSNSMLSGLMGLLASNQGGGSPVGELAKAASQLFGKTST